MEVQAKSTPEQKISEMVRRIVEGFHPDKIILFGSYARGPRVRIAMQTFSW